MAKDFSFQFKPGDYLRDTQLLSEAAQVAYDRIMCEHIRNTSEDMNNICVTYDSVKFLTKRLTDDDKNAVLHVLTEIPGSGYQISWVAESVAERRAYVDSRRKNRQKKDEKNKNISLSYEKHMTPHMDSDSDSDSEEEIVLGDARGETDHHFERIWHDQEFCAMIARARGWDAEQLSHVYEQFRLKRLTETERYDTYGQEQARFEKWCNSWVHNQKTNGNGVTQFKGKDRFPQNGKSRPSNILTDGETALVDAILDGKIQTT